MSTTGATHAENAVPENVKDARTAPVAVWSVLEKMSEDERRAWRVAPLENRPTCWNVPSMLGAMMERPDLSKRSHTRLRSRRAYRKNAKRRGLLLKPTS